MGKEKTKWLLLGWKIVLALFLGGVLFVLIGGYWYLNSFSWAAGLNRKEVISQVYSGLRNPYRKRYLTFLILGLDRRPHDNSLLTDTILLTTINSSSGNYLLFSLPRDLWLDDLKTKINALYYYGQKRDPNDGTELVKKRVETILDWPIDYVVVLEMGQIKDLIDSLGGVELEVKRGFVDEEFPRDDGSGGVMRVSFEAGKQVFSGQRALEFMRSRKSKDPIEGTDQARQRRQKEVILALKNKLIHSRRMFFNPVQAGKLYRFLEELKISPPLDLKTAASFWSIGIKAIKGKQEEKEIPWQGEKAVLIPARDPLYHSWILTPSNHNWEKIKKYFHQSLP